ncbi:probable DNA replication complex GINS protein PSF2 [Phymastichus coffea]|uniref:probable DNA replication complex GINS protein PSF2 n=1 Tax=Phymastichus coffea TaxID=108790 RepID=UPI00273C497B|nr:probable DNA replication complex GINS protein PSF2 [Phymastichus coffea]
MNPSEVEFLGEKHLVSIVPNFTFNVIHLISGPIGPFRAGLPIKVPIWVALNLKQQQKCKIVHQEWMNTEKLQSVLEEEKVNKLFTKMPSSHYMDESHLVLTHAPDDIPDVDNVRTAIKDIWDLRMSKLRSSIINFVQTEPTRTYAKLDHLTELEICSVRSLLPDALDIILYMDKRCDKSQGDTA